MRFDSRHLLGWLLILGIGGAVLLFVLVWTVASIRTPDEPAPAGEERAIGFFDPHVHIQLLEVTELGDIPETAPPSAGQRRWAVRLQARSSAVEIFGDPSRLSVTVRDGGRAFSPRPPEDGPIEIDGVEVRQRFTSVLAAGALQQGWFIFDLPTDLDAPEIWLSKDSWLASNLYGWEASPLHDKAILSLTLRSDSAEKLP